MAETQNIREDQADMRLWVSDRNGNMIDATGGNPLATYSGAKLVAAGSKTRPGGMGKEKALGGPASRGDVTFTIQNSPTMVGLHSFLESRIGKGDCLGLLTYLDVEGNAIPGATFKVTGKLKESSLPDQSFDSANVGMYTFVVDADEVAA